MRAAAFFVCVCALAQGQFEVASIKPNPGGPGTSGIDTSHGRLEAHNVTLKRCILGAYAVSPSQVAGGPDWLDSDRFDILAKPDGSAGEHSMMKMLQGLMADRFHLALHRETRPLQVYVLEVAKGGPKLEKAAEGGPSSTHSSRGGLVAGHTDMATFAQVLARSVDLPVVDRTGLEGSFNFKLEWTPESDRNRADAGPSIFTALQEQLGLRLRAQKVPAEVIVIDHAERPTEN
jgi:uncharacterized protein (TIGR03435 family)